MNFEKLRQLVGMNWANLLKPFMVEGESGTCPYGEISTFLQTEKANGINFLPAGPNVFRAFRETPLEHVRVVLLGQDPYFKAGYATGLAFGTEAPGKLPVALQKIVDGLEDMYNGLDFQTPNRDHSLASWAQQGVLLLNTALTVREGEAGSHAEKWEPFTRFLVKALEEVKVNTIWVPLGKPARETIKDVNSFRNFVFPAEHPTAAARDGGRAWAHNNVFIKVNLCIKLNKLGEQIVW